MFLSQELIFAALFLTVAIICAICIAYEVALSNAGIEVNDLKHRLHTANTKIQRLDATIDYELQRRIDDNVMAVFNQPFTTTARVIDIRS